MQNNFIFEAIQLVAPGAKWAFVANESNNDHYEQIQWIDLNGNKKPTKEQIEQAIEECKIKTVPFQKLRQLRNNLLLDSDWIIAKSIENEKPIPQEWKEYRQKLRDLPKTETPEIDEYGNLNFKKINLPQKPL
jgi:hypothetical protein